MIINILSPHIDDAAYSLATTLYHLVQNQAAIRIINCFTITNWTISYVPGGTKEITSIRKKEDAKFFEKYKAPISVINLDMLDAPLRGSAIFKEKPFRKIDRAAIEKLKVYLKENIDGILFCPLAIGNHIDHAICNEAAIQLYKEMKIIFYEDLPYASRVTGKNILSHTQKLEKRLSTTLVPYLSEMNDSLINKERELQVYKTQINKDISDEIIGYLKHLSGERIWGNALLIRELSSYLQLDGSTK